MSKPIHQLFQPGWMRTRYDIGIPMVTQVVYQRTETAEQLVKMFDRITERVDINSLAEVARWLEIFIQNRRPDLRGCIVVGMEFSLFMSKYQIHTIHKSFPVPANPYDRPKEQKLDPCLWCGKPFPIVSDSLATPVYYRQGNRDMYGRTNLKEVCSVQCAGEPLVVNLTGQPTIPKETYDKMINELPKAGLMTFGSAQEEKWNNTYARVPHTPITGEARNILPDPGECLTSLDPPSQIAAKPVFTEKEIRPKGELIQLKPGQAQHLLTGKVLNVHNGMVVDNDPGECLTSLDPPSQRVTPEEQATAKPLDSTESDPDEGKRTEGKEDSGASWREREPLF